MIKNIKVVEEIINTNLKEDDVSNLFKGKINYIPFWVFLIRNMSELYILLISIFFGLYLQSSIFMCFSGESIHHKNNRGDEYHNRQPRNNILNISWSSFCSHF